MSTNAPGNVGATATPTPNNAPAATPDPGMKSSEVIGAPIAGALIALVNSGYFPLTSDRAKIVVSCIVGGMWALLFIGRTLLKYGHVKAGGAVYAADQQLSAVVAALEKGAGVTLALPGSALATTPAAPAPAPTVVNNGK